MSSITFPTLIAPQYKAPISFGNRQGIQAFGGNQERLSQLQSVFSIDSVSGNPHYRTINVRFNGPLTIKALKRGLPEGVPLFIGKTEDACKLQRIYDSAAQAGSYPQGGQDFLLLHDSLNKVFPSMNPHERGFFGELQGYFIVRCGTLFYVEGVPTDPSFIGTHSRSLNGTYFKARANLPDQEEQALQSGMPVEIQSGNILRVFDSRHEFQ